MRLSIITPTLNNEIQILPFLASLKKQTFSQKNIEYIFVDGGSTDKTKSVARRFGVRIFDNPYVLAEPGVNIGMEKASGDLIMILATDNFFLQPQAIEIIVHVFNNPKIFAAIPKHDSEKTYSIFSKYHNYFTDPFSHFVYGDAANNRTFHRVYKTVEHNAIYNVYDFTSNADRPLIALAQGFTIRSSFSRKSQDAFDDIEPIMKLIKEGKQIAYVHSVSVYHNTIRNISHFMRKQRWATLNALQNKPYGVKHRINSFSPNQQLRMKFWPLYAFSFVFPFIRSLIGVIQDRTPLWLFHPINCFLSGWASTTQVLSYNIGKVKNISRQ